MQVIADLCIEPLGVGVSMTPYIQACEKILDDAGLNRFVHAWGTNVEGDWDQVMTAVKRCHEKVHQMGAARISTTLKLDTRTDHAQDMRHQIDAVRRAG